MTVVLGCHGPLDPRHRPLLRRGGRLRLPGPVLAAQGRRAGRPTSARTGTTCGARQVAIVPDLGVRRRPPRGGRPGPRGRSGTGPGRRPAGRRPRRPLPRPRLRVGHRQPVRPAGRAGRPLARLHATSSPRRSPSAWRWPSRWSTCPPTPRASRPGPGPTRRWPRPSTRSTSIICATNPDVAFPAEVSLNTRVGDERVRPGEQRRPHHPVQHRRQPVVVAADRPGRRAAGGHAGGGPPPPGRLAARPGTHLGGGAALAPGGPRRPRSDAARRSPHAGWSHPAPGQGML